jgi:hypothetical protein
MEENKWSTSVQYATCATSLVMRNNRNLTFSQRTVTTSETQHDFYVSTGPTRLAAEDIKNILLKKEMIWMVFLV